MMVQIADLGNADICARINAYVTAHKDGTIFHRPDWSVAVEQGCGQTARYLIAQGQYGGIEGVLPLSEIRSLFFGRAMVSSGFAVGGGVLADDDCIADALIKAAWDIAVQKNCPTLELRGGILPEKGWTLKTGQYASFARDLAKDDDAELLAVPRKQRAELRKALGNKLVVEAGSTARDRAAHYAVYSESVRNLGTPVFPRKLFDAVLNGFGHNADILTIRKDGTAIASVLNLYYKGTVMPYWGGGTAAARHWRANDLLYYALMNHSRRRGCTRFDFGRSKLGTGAYAFKKNWGFEPVELTYAVRSADSADIRDINPLDPKYQRKIAMWKKLPLWIANRAGPILSRGLG